MTDRNAVVATLTADQMLDIMMAADTLVEQRDAAREEAAQLRQQLAAETSDPIVWDGSEESSEAICDALHPILGGDLMVVDLERGFLHIYDMNTGHTYGYVGQHCRIRIEGDSFVILPPEEVAGA